MILALLACFHRPPPTPAAGAAECPAPTYALAEEKQALGEVAQASDDRAQVQRVEAALALAKSLEKGADPAQAVETYLRRIAELEAKQLPDRVEGDLTPPQVVEQPLEETAAPTLGPPPLEEARATLAADKPEEAVALLAPYKDDPAVRPLYLEAVDGTVHHAREEAGALFLKARQMPPGPERDAALAEVEARLSALIVDYPESSYIPAVESNLEIVRAEQRR